MSVLMQDIRYGLRMLEEGRKAGGINLPLHSRNSELDGKASRQPARSAGGT